MAQAKEEIYESVDNRNFIKGEISSMERMLKADEQRKHKKILDPDNVKKQIDTQKKYLNKVTPKKKRGVKARDIEKEAKKLHEEIKKELLPTNEFNRRYPKDNDAHDREMDFERAVQRQMQLQSDKKFKAKVRRWKTLRRQIDPDDPHVANVETIRGDNGRIRVTVPKEMENIALNPEVSALVQQLLEQVEKLDPNKKYREQFDTINWDE